MKGIIKRRGTELVNLKKNKYRKTAFLILTLYFPSIADAGNVDTNCDRFREIVNGKPSVTINEQWAQTFFMDTQGKLKTQEDALKLYSNEVGECLIRTAGIDFKNNDLQIIDAKTFRTFRMAGSVPDCNIHTVTFSSSIYKNKEIAGAGSDTIHQMAMMNASPEHKKEIAERYIKSDYSENQKNVSLKLENAQDVLKNLTDLSQKNYCAQQFYVKDLKDDYQDLLNQNKFCKSKFDQNPNLVADFQQCKNWPDSMDAKLKKLKDGLALFDQNKILNDFDKNLYTEFKNNASSLDKALQVTKKNYAKKASEYEIARKNKALLEPLELGKCSQSESISISQFQSGICKNGTQATAGELKGFYDKSIDKMNEKMRVDLVANINKEVFNKVMEGLPFVSTADELKVLNRKVSTLEEKVSKLKSICEMFAMDVSSVTCTQPAYAESLEIGLKAAADKKPTHFLSKAPNEISEKISSYFVKVKDKCDEIQKCRTIYTDQTAECKTKEASTSSEIKEIIDQVYADPVAGPYALSETLKSTIDSIAHADCKELQFDWATPQFLNEYYIPKAKEEFRKLELDQLKNTVSNGKSDYGYGDRNLFEKTQKRIGATECSTNLKQKNEMSALYEQFTSYPKLFSDSMNKMSEQDRELYTNVICGTLKCNESVKRINKNIADGARVALIAAGTVFTAGAGPVLLLTAEATTDSLVLYNKIDHANEEKEALKKGVLTGNYPSSGWISDKISELDAEKRGAWTEAVINTGFAVINIGALKEVKALFKSGKALTTASEEVEAAEVAARVIEQPAAQSAIAKILLKVPKDMKERVMELIKEQFKHRSQEAIKEASGKYAEDKDGKGANDFGKTLIKKMTFDLLGFENATDPKLHETSSNSNYLQLVKDAQSQYSLMLQQQPDSLKVPFK